MKRSHNNASVPIPDTCLNSTGLSSALDYIRERAKLTGDPEIDMLAVYAIAYSDGVNSVKKDKA